MDKVHSGSIPSDLIPTLFSRDNLRPVCTDTDVTSPTDTDTPPPASAVIEGGYAHHSRVQRILAVHHAPVHERVATLGQLAAEAGQEHTASNSVGIAGEARQRRRLADRLRSAFRVHEGEHCPGRSVEIRHSIVFSSH